MRTRFAVYLLIIVFTFTLSGCKKKEFETKTFFEMGTFVSVTFPQGKAKELESAMGYLRELTQSISNDEKNITESAVGSVVKVTPEFQALYDSAVKYNKLSNGAFDTTTLTIARLYGFPDGKYTEPNPDALENAKSATGLENIIIENGNAVKKTNLAIGFGAEGKGYIADKTAEFLRKQGVHDFVINIGGDMRVSGSKNSEPFIVGIVDPQNTGKIIIAIKVTERGVATSGNYERSFLTDGGNKRITHIFNGNTLASADNYASVSVVAKDAAEADALATLYYLSDLETIKRLCAEYATPVFVIDNAFTKHRLCGWEALEAK